MKDLGISPRRFGKFKKVVLEDAKKLAVAFEKDETIFSEYFSVKNENIENSTSPIPQKAVNKNHFVNTENFNVNSERKQNSQEEENSSVNTDTLAVKALTEQLTTKDQQIAEKDKQIENFQKSEQGLMSLVAGYQKKFGALEAPQTNDSMETPTKMKWWRLRVPLWVQWGSWIVLITVSFILLFLNHVLSIFTSIL